MDLQRADASEPLNMTWAGKRSERPRSFQSPEMFFLLTFPFIERASNDPTNCRPEADFRGLIPPSKPDSFRFADDSSNEVRQRRGFAVISVALSLMTSLIDWVTSSG